MLSANASCWSLVVEYSFDSILPQLGLKKKMFLSGVAKARSRTIRSTSSPIIVTIGCMVALFNPHLIIVESASPTATTYCFYSF